MPWSPEQSGTHMAPYLLVATLVTVPGPVLYVPMTVFYTPRCSFDSCS